MSEQQRDANESSIWPETREYGWWRRQYRTLQENRRRKALAAIEAAQKTAVESVQSSSLNPRSVAGERALFARQPRKTAEKSDLKK
jgi:hypothetical protein